MEVATITAINTNGTSTATTANGGEIVVIGTTVTVGNQAFIQGGRLIGEAPSLTYYEIEV